MDKRVFVISFLAFFAIGIIAAGYLLIRGENRNADEAMPEGKISQYGNEHYTNVVVNEINENDATVQEFDYALLMNVGKPFKVKFTQQTEYARADETLNIAKSESFLNEIKPKHRISLFLAKQDGELLVRKAVIVR